MKAKRLRFGNSAHFLLFGLCLLINILENLQTLFL